MNKIIHSILLQGKFFLVEWLNVSYSLIPNPLRKCYLRAFGIRAGGVHIFTEAASSFMWAISPSDIIPLLISDAILTTDVALILATMWE